MRHQTYNTNFKFFKEYKLQIYLEEHAYDCWKVCNNIWKVPEKETTMTKSNVVKSGAGRILKDSVTAAAGLV